MSKTHASPTQAWTCPTCGAAQEPADSCRRCQSDLTLVRQLRERHAELRQHCLALLDQRRLLKATVAAQELLHLSSDESSVRLLAVCYLLQGKFAEAARLLNQV